MPGAPLPVDSPPVSLQTSPGEATPARRFAALWEAGQRPDLAAFLPGESPDPRTLLELATLDLQYRLRQGEPARAEDYCRRWPNLSNDRTALLDLVLAETAERRRLGQPVSLDEYRRRFPTLAADLTRLLAELPTPDAAAGPATGQLTPSGLARAAAVADAAPPATGDCRPAAARQAAEAAARPPWPDVPGFVIEKELGRGGMGVVYRAVQADLKRTVALKMILARAAGSAEVLARFHVEAEAVARLDHPNIVQIYGYGVCDGQPYFALEFVDGGDLARQWHGEPQPPAAVARLLATLAQAMHAAHAKRVIHRDLKPANVLLTRDGVPKVADFGLAKELDLEEAHTRSGALLGTPAYMAPEQAQGDVNAMGPATDVHALGVILYEGLTGRTPYKGPTPLDTLALITETDPVPPRRLQPQVPRDLETICLKCLHKDPARRYASAADLAADLGRFLDGRPILARPIGPAERARKWARRNPALAAAAAAAALAALALVATAAGYNAYLQWALDDARAEVYQVTARSQVQGMLLKAEGALAEDQPAAALQQTAEALGLIDRERLAELRGPAAALRDRARGAVNARARQAAARRLVADFDRAHDEALTAFLPGNTAGADRTARAAAERGLGLVGLGDGAALAVPAEVAAADRDRLADGAVDLLAVLAELAVAEKGPAAARADRAEALVARAERLRPGLRLYPLWRARLARLRQQPAPAAPAGEGPWATAVDAFWAGHAAVLAGRLAEGRDALEAALRLRPDHFWAHYFLAVVALQDRRPAPAVVHLTPCVLQKPTAAFLVVARGLAYRGLGDLAAAEADLTRALDLEPAPEARYVAYLNRGAVRLEQHRLAEAVADLEAVLALRPDEFRTYANLAQAYRQLGQPDRALERLDQAVARAPGQAWLYRERARLHAAAGRPAAAERDYRQALALARADDPGRAQDHLGLAELAHAAGRAADALAAADAALAVDPTLAEGYRLRALAHLALADRAAGGDAPPHYRAAVAALDRHLALLPGPRPALLYRLRALAHLRLGDGVAALADLSRALDAEEDVATRVQRGRVYALVGAYRLAEHDYDRALTAAPAAEVAADRGLVRGLQGRFAAARQDLDAARRGPATAVLLVAQARAQAALLADPGLSPDRRAADAATALAWLRQAAALVPAAQRPAWRQEVAADPWLRPLRGLPGWAEVLPAAEGATTPR